jgi:hypothetical protein
MDNRPVLGLIVVALSPSKSKYHSAGSGHGRHDTHQQTDNREAEPVAVSNQTV